MEGQLFLATGTLTSLSEEQLISCSVPYGNNGCAGGVQVYAFNYIKDNGGIQTEAAYPYVEGKTNETSSVR